MISIIMQFKMPLGHAHLRYIYKHTIPIHALRSVINVEYKDSAQLSLATWSSSLCTYCKYIVNGLKYKLLEWICELSELNNKNIRTNTHAHSVLNILSTKKRRKHTFCIARLVLLLFVAHFVDLSRLSV